MTSENQGWNILPHDMKLEVFKYLEIKDRIKFAKLSYRCFEELVYEKPVTFLHLEKCSESSITLILDYSTAFLKLIFTQHGRVCKVFCDFYFKNQEYPNRDGNFDLITLGNHETMTSNMFENCLKKSKHNLEVLSISNVEFIIRDESIDAFPKLFSLVIETCNREQLFWFLGRAKTINNLKVNFTQVDKLGSQDLIKLPKDFKLSLSALRLTSNDVNVALEILDIVENPGKCWSIEFMIHDEEFAGFDQRLMKIFKEVKCFYTNVPLTNDQFLELSTKLDLRCDAKNIDTSTIIDAMLKNDRTTHVTSLLLSNVDNSILEYKGRIEFNPPAGGRVKNECWASFSYNTCVYDSIKQELRFNMGYPLVDF